MGPIVRHTLIQRTLGELAAQELSRQLDLAGTAGKVFQPLLVVAGGRYELCTADEARRLVEEAAAAELPLIEEGDHLCANTPWLWRPHLADCRPTQEPRTSLEVASGGFGEQARLSPHASSARPVGVYSLSNSAAALNADPHDRVTPDPPWP